MIIEQRAEELTKAYIASYNLAMQKVRNPEFAAQIAGMIVITINETLSKQNQAVNPIMGVLSQMIMAAGQEETEQEETGSQKKEQTGGRSSEKK